MREIKLAFLILLSFLFTLNWLNAQTHCDLLIKNTSIIDVIKGSLISGQDVLINGERIFKIIPTSSEKINAKQTIDGSGKYLIPGLWDMHTHNWWQLHFSNFYVANGVLGVRNMYTPMIFINPLKDSIDNNLIIGPKYFAAGRVLEGPNPNYPDWLVVDSINKINSALDTLQLEKSDFVKIYNKIPRDVYFELVKEVQRRGMSIQGHLPMAVTAIEASNAGQKGFEHLLGIPDLCTHQPLFENKYDYNWYLAVMKEDDYGTMQIDEQLASETFAILKKNNTYVCPTLVVWYSYLHPDTPFEDNIILKNFPDEMADFWGKVINSYREKDESYKQMALKKYETLKKTTYLLYKSGVPLLTGTDAMNPYCYPGYSLHREFELLKECGIPDFEILKMATINAAEFFNLTDYGQIKEGFIASMVLLNDNPLKNIENTKKINSIILKGKVLEPTALDN